MSAHAWPLDSADGVSPAYVGRTLRATTVATALAGARADRPLGALSGVRPGTPVQTVSATSSTWTVQPCAGVIDPHITAGAGPYAWVVSEDETGAMAAASGSYPRWDAIYLVLDDPAEGDGTTTPEVRIEYVPGTPAAQPSMPPTPDRSLALARIVVPVAGGGDPSVVWLAPPVTAAGGIIPRQTTAERDALTALGTPTSPVWVDLAGTLYRSTGTHWTTTDSDTGWVTPAPINSWADSTLQARLRNGIAYLRGYLRPTGGGTIPAGNNSGGLATLPPQMRPSQGQAFATTVWVAGSPTPYLPRGTIEITADGAISIQNDSTGAVTAVMADGVAFPVG